ncbi:AraC family transcriptional regulator [Aquincola sp. MAHUQ-54]|uniref:AraC family transcriptional regulator n=1 Tax=Aquincola agrisoli TaxID=3119538 RepID=A0AAW9QIR8_9BURK
MPDPACDPSTANLLDTRVQSRTVELLRRLAPVEGYTLSPVPEVRYLRSDRPLMRTPVLYEPGIVIVCSGRKRGYFGNEVLRYDTQHYLVVSVALPFSMETDASPAQPLLALYVRLNFRVVADLLMEIDEAAAHLPVAAPKGMVSSTLEPMLQATVLRFLEAMASPVDAAVLGASLLRELYFRALLGSQGGSMRAALAAQGQFGKIARAIRRIHAEYTAPLKVAALAETAGMSSASFHAHFKQVTQVSPLQYLKSTRLHQARLLLVRQAITAAQAGAQVGYESPSQFSREFKRFFGRSPLREADRLRAAFALPAAAEGDPYVSSH